MRSTVLLALVGLSACFATAQAARTASEYPSAMLDIYDTGQGCWTGMDAAGNFVVRVLPEAWLVGSPPSAYSAVTLPSDDWVDLCFSGRIVPTPSDQKPADSNDIELSEWGRAGEQAIVFLTDGNDQEYLVGLAQALSTGGQLATYIGLKSPTVSLPFVPRGVRVVALDDRGSSPGFDLGYVRTWVSHDCGVGALIPNPVSGATNVRPDVKLSWTPGCQARQHIIYLATNESQVRVASPDVRVATQPGDANIFDPSTLVLGQTYYWRVDEVMPDNSVVPGDVWRFTVVDQVIIDDFELYGYLGDVNDAWQIRDRAQRYLQKGSIAHSCQQSMSFTYYCDGKDYSELYHPFGEPQNWRRAGVRVVQLWLYGASGSDTIGQMCLAVADSHKEEMTPFVILDSEALTRPEWTVCRASLAGLSQVDLNDVRGMGIGFYLPKGVPGQGYRGTINVDDISLHPALCLDSLRPTADTNGDCRVDYGDVTRMASQWLASRTNTYAVAMPKAPILWYKFDGDTSDSAGDTPGQIEGRTGYVMGKHRQAVAFRNAGDAVQIPAERVADLFSRTREAITIAFWQVGNDSRHLNDTICCSNYEYGKSGPSISINLGCWRNPGQYRWDCGTPWSLASRVAGHHRDKLEWTGRWNHWVFTKDIRVGSPDAKGRMEIYLNGVLYDRRWGTDSPIEGITSFEIGAGWYGRYDGLIDDFQIYDYALSAPEAAYLASDGTGILEATIPLSADLDYNGYVDFNDFAILASQWLMDGMWP
jgi:hypothetical protein